MRQRTGLAQKGYHDYLVAHRQNYIALTYRVRHSCERRSSVTRCFAVVAGIGLSWVALALLPAQAQPAANLHVWIGADKGVKGLRELGRQFEQRTGVVVKVAHPDAVTDKFSQTAASGHGPDIMICPSHDLI